jgi:uncharacterized protein (UPF0332 family)
VKIATLLRGITLSECFEFNEDDCRLIVLVLDGLLQDVRFPSIIFDIVVLLQVILRRNFEYKSVLADYGIIERLFFCLPRNHRVFSRSLVSELTTLLSEFFTSLLSEFFTSRCEIVELVRTSFWVVSCHFAADIAARFLPIFASLLNHTDCDDCLTDDCLTPEQFQQLNMKFLQEELLNATKFSWFAFAAQLLLRASDDFLKHACLSPSFVEEFSETLECDDLALIRFFLSAMQHLRTICDADKWTWLLGELVSNGVVPDRVRAFHEATSPDEETGDLLALIDQIFPAE